MEPGIWQWNSLAQKVGSSQLSNFETKVVAKLVDSPDSAKDEAVLQLTKKGLEDGE